MTAQTGATTGSHAEVRQVWPRDGRIRVLGTVVTGGVPDAAPADRQWLLRLTSRERSDTVTPPVTRRLTNRFKHIVTGTSVPTPRRLLFPVTSDGADFEAVVRVRDLAVWDALPQELWDLELVATRGGKKVILRVGGHLDDMPGKKQIVKFPEQSLAGVAVLPYYTDSDDLSVRTARISTSDQGAA
ncbi:hypothetical protein ACQPZG_00120 (plasmid) [Streptomyces sp. CA-294286]|uniref:hypothetical protein n=1 Tax=Streptomyces sp. CA-294286 TaxID=3240070 RepID=UPI003D91F035